MINRRLTTDPGGDIGEPLDENGTYGLGN